MLWKCLEMFCKISCFIEIAAEACWKITFCISVRRQFAGEMGKFVISDGKFLRDVAYQKLLKSIDFSHSKNRRQGSSSLSSVLGWPRRVQLNRLSSAAPLHYDQSSHDTENSDPVRKTGLLCLRFRRVEQSCSICLHRRLPILVLPPCSQNSSVPACV